MYAKEEDKIFESIHPMLAKKKESEPEMVTEAAKEMAVDDLAEQQIRSMAMGAALAWIDDGEYTFDAMDSLVEGLSDLDESEELSDDEMVVYNDLMTAVGMALEELGADPAMIESALTGDDEAATELGYYLEEKMEEMELDDDELVSEFSTKAALITEGVKRVIRDGKVKYIRTNRRKRKMTAKQKAALKKARMKANTSAAKLARKKSMKLRK